eukprot:135011-Lingulodinium_polyedra.AAC.1
MHAASPVSLAVRLAYTSGTNLGPRASPHGALLRTSPSRTKRFATNSARTNRAAGIVGVDAFCLARARCR